jgi:biotin carboxyl carrier protein
MPAREQDAAQVQRDHDAISGLADELLPALIAKLAASGLGEIEVRQGGWKARLRKPATLEPRPAKPAAGAPGSAHGAVRGGAALARGEERDLRGASDEAAADADPRIAAKSPAVGIYNPRKDLAVGMKVRSGDRIATVNVLGVNEDVVAPVDGVIGSSLVEAGEAVEYGQELVRIELPESVVDQSANAPGRETAGTAGKA